MPRLFRFLLPLLLSLAPALLAETPPASGQLTFLRSEDQEKVAAMRTLSEEFKPADGQAGPAIWLVGVAHIGTPEYYAALQKRLDEQSIVLYEGIDAERLKDGFKPNAEKGIQSQLAKALGLVFQLDGIDYQRPNFVNCDLKAAELRQAITARSARAAAARAKHQDGASAAEPTTPSTGEKKDKEGKDNDNDDDTQLPAKVDEETLDSLMHALRGEGNIGAKLNGMVALMGSTPEMRETMKLTFIEALGQAGDLLNAAKAASPQIRHLLDVIVNERNENVIRQIKDRLAKAGPGETIAVFYGGAHMDEIAKRLGEELHYTPGTQVWDTAFTADTTKSMMTPAQIKMLVQTTRTQLQNSKGKGGGLDALLGVPPEKGAAEKSGAAEK